MDPGELRGTWTRDGRDLPNVQCRTTPAMTRIETVRAKHVIRRCRADGGGPDALDFEASWWKYAGAKETAIRDTFDATAVRYFQRLNALVDRPQALAYAPLTVKRLQRLRRARTAHRSPVDAGFHI